MATYGTRDGTRFQINGVQYYTLIESDGPNKGQITIKSPTLQGATFGANSDRTVGTIPLDNSFRPSTAANVDETQYFSSANGQKVVKNQAVITVKKAGLVEQQARQLIFPNTATPGGTTTPASLPVPVEGKTVENEEISNLASLIKDSEDESAAKVKETLTSTNIVYPRTISAEQDRIKFTLKEITGRDFDSQGSNFSFGTKKVTSLGGSVILPIQPSITDSNGVDWGGANLDPLSAYAGRASLSLATSDNITQEVVKQFQEAGKQFKTNYETYKQAINLYLAQEAIGAQGLFSRGTGSILNPNLELLFNGPTLRPFNFTFRLSPREAKEAQDVKKIIYFFKSAMAVRKANTGVFLKAPYIFSIQYFSGNSVHKSLNKIKDCALLGCDVDYTPDGSYMTFNDEGKTMTSYQLTLRFSELDPIYNTDYADHPIGY